MIADILDKQAYVHLLDILARASRIQIYAI